MPTSRVHVTSIAHVFEKSIFRLNSVRFWFARSDGSDSGPLEHYVLDAGDSVGMLIHDTKRGEVVLVRQVRVAALEVGGELLEIPAGRIGPGETPEEAAARESFEEVGVRPEGLEHISTFFLSPGVLSERLHLFYCPCGAFTVGNQGGLEEEGEDLTVMKVPVSEALEMARTGLIQDAKTLIAIQHLMATGSSGAQ